MKISIVTPTYNAPMYLAQTIKSIAAQSGDFELQYIVIDGGSTDETVDVIKAHDDQIDYWVSEPDGGMYDAIVKGFAQADGDVLAWLNADDLYYPWALNVVARVFQDLPEVSWITSLNTLIIDAAGDIIDTHTMTGISQEAFLDGVYMVPFAGAGTIYSTSYIQQESTFFRRSLWEEAGPNPFGNYKYAGDFALWARFMGLSVPTGIAQPLGAFRYHSKGQISLSRFGDYVQESQRAFEAAVQDNGHVTEVRPEGEAAMYTGKAAVKEEIWDPQSKWILKEHDFHVVPAGPLRSMMRQKILM